MQLESLSVSQIISDSQQGEAAARAAARGNPIGYINIPDAPKTPDVKPTNAGQAALDAAAADLEAAKAKAEGNKSASLGVSSMMEQQNMMQAVGQMNLLNKITGVTQIVG